MIIGYSTGAIEGKNLLEKVKLIKAAGCKAIELSALRMWELPELELNLTQEVCDLISSSFSYVSVHLPKETLCVSDEVCVGNCITAIDYLLPVNSFVMHPDGIINFPSWKLMGPKLVIENMDRRSAFGKTHESLNLIFKALLPEAGFCLDVAHAYDSNWYPREDIKSPVQLDQDRKFHFQDRLRQVHLSGLLLGKHTRLGDPALKMHSSKVAVKDAVRRLSKLDNPPPFILESPIGISQKLINWEVKEVENMAK